VKHPAVAGGEITSADAARRALFRPEVAALNASIARDEVPYPLWSVLYIDI
jgi:hypothetical protein